MTDLPSVLSGSLPDGRREVLALGLACHKAPLIL